MVWPFFEAFKTDTAEEILECDYERDCSALYKALESAIEPEEYEPIVKFLDTGFWPGAFFPDGASPAEQAKMWVTRFDPLDAKKVKWSQLPLHLAIVCGAPPAVIGRLVKLYPQALRCTDDQHMLPLHLALRHSASDEVVAYLLMQFPDAVNAKGKNGRSAIDSALRAKDKLRGKILEIFVEKSKGKKSASIIREQEQLKAELKAKTDEVTDLKADLEAMAANFESIKKLKNSIESDLLTKIQDLEQAQAEQEAMYAEKIERIQNEKLLESLEIQKKLESLEATKSDLEAAEKFAREAEADIRYELGAIHGRVAKSNSPNDWQHLKTEVGSMEAYRLQRNRSETKMQIDALKQELERTMKEVKTFEVSAAENTDTKAELQSDLKLIQSNVNKLEKTETSDKTTEELNALRNEVDLLRTELRERAEASKTRVELSVLKKAMEVELRHAQGKTDDELAALRKAVAKANNSKLDTKTNAELAALKMDLESLKKEMKNKELVGKTRTELDDLRESLETEMQTAGSSHKTELASMKKTADQLRAHLDKTHASDGIILIKKTVERMKDELKKKDTTMKIMDEVSTLKSSVEAELKRSDGKTQEELLQMKKQIKSLNEKELATKDVDELVKIKADLADVKNVLKEIEKASKVQQELDALKKTLASEMKNTAIKAEHELAMMKKAVDQVNLEQKESKKLKKSLAEEIKEANKKTEQELIEMKKALDALDVKKLESKNKDGWDAIRIEMDALKAELAAKKASNDIATELDFIKKTVEGLNLGKMEQKTNSEFKSIREEMDALRANLKRKDQEEAALKKEIEVLKKNDKKKGIKKFFTRHFIRKNNEEATVEEVKAALSPPSGVVNVAESSALDHVSTIAPPRMTNSNFEQTASSDDSCADDDEVTAASTGQVLAKLSASFVEDVPPVVETVQTADSTPSKQPPKDSSPIEQTAPSSTKKLPPTKFRKAQSMDPRIASPTAASVPTASKTSETLLRDYKDVELEMVDTTEDDILIPSPSAVAAQ